MIKKGDKQNHNFSKLMMVLALGAIIAMPGIASCKKSKSNGVVSRQIYYNQNYPTGNVGHAPLPGTLTLLGSGLAALGLIGWRKRKKP
jgi:PEP-CTERM motif